MNTFYWHDYETWGANPAFDRPVQFAGIRTDEKLEIIGDPLNIMCRPADDFVPHPEACLVTGISPQQAMAEGLSEPEFIRLIHEQLAAPGTCGVGYNSIRFDDEVTRYSLWRNFYDPYEREWKNGNSRWDIIDMVRLTYALRPEGIEWPLKEGVPSFKLEELSAANNLSHENAHDALSDVYATIELAKLILQKQPRLFHYLLPLRDKRKVAELIDIPSCKPLLHISSMFPAERGCAALVVPLVMHPVNKNSVVCFDLSSDPSILIDKPAEFIQERLYTKTEDLPEGESRIALKEIHLNKSPVLATARLLEPASAERLGLDLSVCREHWKKIKGHTLGPKLHDVFAPREFDNNREAEASLYGGFLSAMDKQRCEQVRNTAASDLLESNVVFEDDRLNDLLLRYRARNYPETLTEEEETVWQEYRYQRLTQPATGIITLDELHEKVFALQESGQLTPEQLQLLDALSTYADEIV